MRKSPSIGFSDKGMAKFNSNQRCEICGWAEDNAICEEIMSSRSLNLRLPNGDVGVFCGCCHKVKKKDGGKYCGSFYRKS